MRLFSKLNNSDIKNDFLSSQQTSHDNMTASTLSATVSVPRYDVAKDDTIGHILPSFQMHQFYINRSMIIQEEEHDMEGVPPPPMSDTRSIISGQSSSSASSSSSSRGPSNRRRSSVSRRRSRPVVTNTGGSGNGGTRRRYSASGSASIHSWQREEEMLHDLFYRDINFDSEKESILNNLHQLPHSQNSFIKMGIFVLKNGKENSSSFKQVTSDFSVREYQAGDEVVGFVTIANNSTKLQKFDMFFTYLFGELSVVRGIGSKCRHLFLKMIDLESSLAMDEELQIGSDGYYQGLPASKTLSPGHAYKVPFKFVIPETLLDNSCEHEISHHLRLPPSLGISKDSSGWLGNIPEKGYVCHNLSAIHSFNSHDSNGSGSDNKSFAESYMKGGDGIFTNDICPNGLSITYGVHAVLIGDAGDFRSRKKPTLSNYTIVNDAKYQLRVVPHYEEPDNEHAMLQKFAAAKNKFHSMENLRVRFEKEISRVEDIIGEARLCKLNEVSCSSEDEERPSRKMMSKSKQMELSALNSKLTGDNDTLTEWKSASQSSALSASYHRTEIKRKLKELKEVEKDFLNQKMTSDDSFVCSVLNFLTKSSQSAIQGEISGISKTNPTLFSLDRLNRCLIDQFSRASFLKISCDSVNFNLIYSTPLKYKNEKNDKSKTIWNMISDKKKSAIQTNDQLLTPHRTPENVSSSSGSTSHMIDLDLDFISVKGPAQFDQFAKPPQIKNVRATLCAITVDSKHPLPLLLRPDMFLNATNENVDLNNEEGFSSSGSRKLFSFTKHNNSGIIPEFKNYKERLVKLSKEVELYNAGKEEDEEVVINPALIKALNSLITLRYSKVFMEQDIEVRSFKLMKQNWDITQFNSQSQTKLDCRNKLSMVLNINTDHFKETLVPSFQSCLIARMYCLKIDLELEIDDYLVTKGSSKSKRKAVVYIPLEII